jgi:hypothetical protein
MEIRRHFPGQTPWASNHAPTRRPDGEGVFTGNLQPGPFFFYGTCGSWTHTDHNLHLLATKKQPHGYFCGKSRSRPRASQEGEALEARRVLREESTGGDDFIQRLIGCHLTWICRLLRLGGECGSHGRRMPWVLVLILEREEAVDAPCRFIEKLREDVSAG